jgi:ketosteroid isomerase-like protein
MSQQNLEIVRLAHEAWNRDDFSAARLLVHPDVELRNPPDLFLDLENVYRGHAGFREWWEAGKDPWDYFESHIERTLQEDNKVVTVVRFEAVGKTSGAKVELHFANVWELDGGLIVKFTAYHSLEDALKAADLAA